MCICLYLDNIIRENQWGGVDIRHGGDPVITQNVICNGMSDGIVIGEKGRGSIENNIITGQSAKTHGPYQKYKNLQSIS